MQKKKKERGRHAKMHIPSTNARQFELVWEKKGSRLSCKGPVQPIALKATNVALWISSSCSGSATWTRATFSHMQSCSSCSMRCLMHRSGSALTSRHFKGDREDNAEGDGRYANMHQGFFPACFLFCSSPSASNAYLNDGFLKFSFAFLNYGFICVS